MDLSALGVWKTALAPRPDDPDNEHRERLRVELKTSSDYADLLSSRIIIDHSGFTPHDRSHTEALSELVQLIVGENTLNPAEAFVLGEAILVHDIAMTESAFPGGILEFVDDRRFADLVVIHYKRLHSRNPVAEELQNPLPDVLDSVKSALLREEHATQSARVPRQEFSDGKSSFFILSNVDLRNWYADLIGRISASHWWDTRKLSAEFGQVQGAPGPFPREWTVDPLKLACLLRIADACHIDSSRAPGFLRAVQAIPTDSVSHWNFQERMQKPQLDGDRLLFTASRPFGPDESDAWWLCVDTLRAIDRELNSVDTLLADHRRPRLSARSVAYVNDLTMLAKTVAVQNWTPIDTQIRVGNVVDLVKKLGGAELYGNRPTTGLRELVMNAADAVRARKILEGHESEVRFRVLITLDIVEGEKWLRVIDNGLGMSASVMGGALLDFGQSYWTSDSARADLPGLVSSGFSATGRFGIGFFATFMLGDEVIVRSRRYDAGKADTHILSFRQGLNQRPILRQAPMDKAMNAPGTEVSVKIGDETYNNLFRRSSQSKLESRLTLSELCAWEFPTIDVDLDVSVNGERCSVIEQNDWLTLSQEDLLARLTEGDDDVADLKTQLTPLYREGSIVGRLGLKTLTSRYSKRRRPRGLITIGGARSDSALSHVVGLVMGEPITAARDMAHPLADRAEFSRWATVQAELMSDQNLDPETQLHCSSIVAALGGATRGLFVAAHKFGHLKANDFNRWSTDKDIIYLYQDAAFSLEIEKVVGPEASLSCLHSNVLVVDMGVPGVTQHRRQSAEDWTPDPLIDLDDALYHVCARRVGEAWGIRDSVIDEEIYRQIELRNSIEDGKINPDSDTNRNFVGHYEIEVGKLPDGESVVGSVYTLNRSQLLRKESE